MKQKLIVAIHAYEGMYQTLHGIESFSIHEVDDIEEAYEIAAEESIEVMNSYTDVMDEFYENAKNMDIEEDSEEWDEYIGECICENLAYEVYVVRNKYADFEKMQRDFYYDKDRFMVMAKCIISDEYEESE